MVASVLSLHISHYIESLKQSGRCYIIGDVNFDWVVMRVRGNVAECTNTTLANL